MSPFFSAHTFKEPQSWLFTVNPWRGNPPAVFQNVTFGVENTLSVKFILPSPLPLYPPSCFLCNDMQEPGLTLGTHVLWICYISFMLFVVKSSKHFCVWGGLCSLFFIFIFPPPRLWLCVCWGVSDFFIFFPLLFWCLFSALLNLISLFHPFVVSIWFFSTCN